MLPGMLHPHLLKRFNAVSSKPVLTGNITMRSAFALTAPAADSVRFSGVSNPAIPGNLSTIAESDWAIKKHQKVPLPQYLGAMDAALKAGDYTAFNSVKELYHQAFQDNYDCPTPLALVLPDAQSIATLDLAQLNLDGLKLMTATGEKINLDNMDFSGRTFSSADFSQCTLRGADFQGATLKNVNFEGVIATGAHFEESQIQPGTCFAGADLTDAQFDRAVIVDASFAGATCIRAGFTLADIQESSFEGGIFDGANFTDCEMGPEEGTGAPKSMRGTLLDSARIHCLSFEDTDMTGASMINTLFADECVINNTTMTQANLCSVEFSEDTLMEGPWTLTGALYNEHSLFPPGYGPTPEMVQVPLGPDEE